MSWVFAAMFAALSVFYALRCSSGSQRSVDGSRAVMSLGMAAMLVPSLDPLPRLGWQLLFGVAAAHIALRLIRHLRRRRSAGGPGHRELHLLIGALAMVYMFAVMPAGQHVAHEMSLAASSTGLAIPLLSWAFVVYFVVFAVRLGARLAVPVDGAAATGARSLIVSPHLLGSSEVVMGIGMSYMLITML